MQKKLSLKNYISFLVSPFLQIPDIGWTQTSDLRDDEDPEVVCPAPTQVDQL